MNLSAGDIVKDNWGNPGAVLEVYREFKDIPRELRKYTLIWVTEPLSIEVLKSDWVYIEYINRSHGMHPVKTLKLIKTFRLKDLY